MLMRAPVTRLRRLLLPIGTAGMVAGGIFGGYRFIAHPPEARAADVAALAPAAPVEGPPRCAGSSPVPGASGAVCKRPVAGEPKALLP
jgi:hypothetical protein